jgi:hypothetical protein
MILANNFVGPDEEPGRLFVSRMLTPLFQILRNVASNHEHQTPDSLKLLILTMHNTNISNILRALTYWDTHGYKKFSRFNSSVRLELVKKTTKMASQVRYFVRIIYDEEEVSLPQVCGRQQGFGNLCPLESFIAFLESTLITDQ